MSKINYKSDFDFTLRIYECTVGPDGQKTRVEMGFPTYDFEIRLYTTNRTNAYICSKKGNKLQNCFNDEGKIHVVCDNHHLGKGVLHAEFTAFLPNNIYPDGSRKTVEVSHTVIELVDGSGDSPSIDDLKLTPAFVSDQGEALRVEAENKRVEAEAERKVAEATRTDSEAQRVEAEAKRNADEAKRIEAENKRKTTEAQRAESEALRDNTEAQRCEAEGQRVAAENLRKTDEEARKTAETQRVTAENERKAAEAQRAKDFEAIKQEVAVEDRIGIFPFNSIVEAHDSVIDDAPSYATQFPSMADGAYRHIIFDKSRRTFLWEIHAGDYPDCPAGDAYRAWKGSEEYVSDGHPRTDRLYRMGNELYRWDGTALRSYSADSKEPPQSFIDMWNKACDPYGKYAPDEAPDALHPFLLNELWLTYDEALEVMDAGKACDGSYSYRYASNFKRIRTNLPPISVVSSMAMDGAFSGQKLLEVALCYNGAISVTTFHNCSKLRKIIGPLKSLGNGIHKAFGSCYALEDMEAPIIKKGTYDLADCKKISLNSLAYSVGHKTVADAVTIIVHPEVYAKLTDESNSEWHQVLTDAINNNITFATT